MEVEVEFIEYLSLNLSLCAIFSFCSFIYFQEKREIVPAILAIEHDHKHVCKLLTVITSLNKCILEFLSHQLLLVAVNDQDPALLPAKSSY